MEPVGIIASIGLSVLGHLLGNAVLGNPECNHIIPLTSPVAVVNPAPVDNSNAKRKAKRLLRELKGGVIQQFPSHEVSMTISQPSIRLSE